MRLRDLRDNLGRFQDCLFALEKVARQPQFSGAVEAFFEELERDSLESHYHVRREFNEVCTLCDIARHLPLKDRVQLTVINGGK